jgi:hypothetical protein
MWLSDEKNLTQTMENDYYSEHFEFYLEQWFGNFKIHQ